MKLIAVESPYGSDDWQEIAENIHYLRACMHYVHLQGNAPYASHAISTQPGVLDDSDKGPGGERETGIFGGQAIADRMDEKWVFMDKGMTTGMEYGYKRSGEINQPILIKELGPDWHRYVAKPKPDDVAWFWANLNAQIPHSMFDVRKSTSRRGELSIGVYSAAKDRPSASKAGTQLGALLEETGAAVDDIIMMATVKM
jgi:hypothetical protein